MTIHPEHRTAAPDVSDDDEGVHAFLTLGDDLVRTLTDALQRLDLLRGILEDTEVPLPQQHSARDKVRDLIAAVEYDIRVANASMLSITRDWLMPVPDRTGPRVIRSTPLP